jgi:hypothetical protein
VLGTWDLGGEWGPSETLSVCNCKGGYELMGLGQLGWGEVGSLD